MSEPRPAILPIFRSDHQAAIVGAIFSQPDRVWTGPELGEATGASQPTVSRETIDLADAGLVLRGSIGRTSTVQADPSSPVFDELVRLAMKTWGPIEVLDRHLAGLKGLREAHIVGSWAARWHGRHGRFPNDVDVALVGDVPLFRAIEVCRAASEEIGLTVQPTIVPADEWDERRSAFSDDVRSQPTVPLTTTQIVPA